MRARKSFVLVAVLCILSMAVALLAGCGKKAPEISSITPDSVEAGAEITITGSNLGESQGDGIVQLGNEEPDIDSWSDTSIKATVLKDTRAGEFKVTVKTDGGTSNSVDLTVKEAEKKETEKKEEPKPETEATPQVIIVEYYKAKGESIEGTNPTTGGPYTPELFKQSKTDPNWELWDLPMGGDDVDTLLLHQENGQWKVVAYSQDSVTSTPKLNPQENGAPADLTWDGWPPQ